MKKITSKVSYIVPHWAFCNEDKFDLDGSKSKKVCKFCKVSKSGADCLLYNKSLSVSNGLVSKTRACEKATAGFESTIDSDNAVERPVINPKKVIKHTVDLYIKTYNDLLNDGYPRQMAEALAKEAIIGGN